MKRHRKEAIGLQGLSKLWWLPVVVADAVFLTVVFSRILPALTDFYLVNPALLNTPSGRWRVFFNPHLLYGIYFGWLQMKSIGRLSGKIMLSFLLGILPVPFLTIGDMLLGTLYILVHTPVWQWYHLSFFSSWVGILGIIGSLQAPILYSTTLVWEPILAGFVLVTVPVKCIRFLRYRGIDI
jgi:hypothetical protein